ncbi:MAG: hypothetical protein ACYDAY_05495 [Candidatus Dormibacteria bacterium]
MKLLFARMATRRVVLSAAGLCALGAAVPAFALTGAAPTATVVAASPPSAGPATAARCRQADPAASTAASGSARAGCRAAAAGRVTATAGTIFTLTGPHGKTVTVNTSASTVFSEVTDDGTLQKSDAAAVQTGMTMIARGERTGAVVSARRVVFGTPAAIRAYRARHHHTAGQGAVTASPAPAQ